MRCAVLTGFHGVVQNLRPPEASPHARHRGLPHAVEQPVGAPHGRAHEHRGPDSREGPLYPTLLGLLNQSKSKAFITKSDDLYNACPGLPSRMTYASQ